jgi:hypothetical protein
MADFRQEVSDDVQRMGKAFGSFIEDVGKGVAETQKKLDINSAAISQELADTEIEVPSVVEQVLQDDGTPATGPNAVNVLRQKMSLIQFIVPTFYQWRHVQLNLNFDVEEIGSIKDFKIRTSREYNRGLFGIPTGSRVRRTGEGTADATDTKSADGALDARLEPRPDITPPSPFLFRTGPTINFIPGEDEKDTSGKVIGANLTIQVYKANGDPNNDQPLKVSVNQGRYTVEGSSLTTGDDGTVAIKVFKPDPTTAETQVVAVSVALGIVTGRVNVTI